MRKYKKVDNTHTNPHHRRHNSPHVQFSIVNNRNKKTDEILTDELLDKTLLELPTPPKESCCTIL